LGVLVEPLKAQQNIISTSIDAGYDAGYSIKVQDDGKIVVGGFYATCTNDDL
jgi:hypothetical protein